ncbi:Urease accessory protein D [Hypsizygus marmoreus]|uniref:Urease accessory protein D n=1 Tax=Hypsizygus marmoreus TaxID=39966 RepID=A0A369K3H9_HYPMA|nr:Urease accessory protein D [Hypsizygus marmoreus]
MQSPSSDVNQRTNPGLGRISLTTYGSGAVFTELSSTYPLKLLSPRITGHVATVYMLTYGGGLVGGDHISLSVDVDATAILVLLSQGSTKVFKTRLGQRRAVPTTRPTPAVTDNIASSNHALTTMQNLTFSVAAEGALFMLPQPVTCFRSASYTQMQTFYLSRNASLVLLDWLTSGRVSMGEEWAFSRYYSANEVWVEGRRIAKDVMLLDDLQVDTGAQLAPRTLRDRLSPYSCYAMVILCGPLVQGTIHHLGGQYDQISVFKTRAPAGLIWSLSHMPSGGGAIVRVAGKETESVKKWLGQALVGLQETIGIDVYQQAFQ